MPTINLTKETPKQKIQILGKTKLDITVIKKTAMTNVYIELTKIDGSSKGENYPIGKHVIDVKGIVHATFLCNDEITVDYQLL